MHFKKFAASRRKAGMTPSTKMGVALDKDAHERSSSEVKKKDAWDKAGVIAQYLSGVVIAAVGGYFTYSNNQAQQQASARIAQAQLEVSYHQLTSTYVNQLVSQKETGARTDLVGSLDLSLRPEDAIPIALRYARANQDPRVTNEALTVLRHLKGPGESTLKNIRDSGAMPEAAIAEAILGDKIHVRVRVSQIDDFGSLFISVAGQTTPHSPVGPVYKYGQDSGWIDITDRLTPGTENLLLFKVANGPYGGSSGRLEISAGSQQYDSRLVALPGCPCDKDAFFILAHLAVYDRVDKDGSVGLGVGEPETYPWPGHKIPH